MNRIILGLVALIAWCSAALAQPVTVIGPITPGDCAFFNSTTVIKDAGFNCNGAPGGAITGLTGDGTATGPGSVPFVLATVTANVGAFGSATQCVTVTNNAKGLTTAISATTCTPALGSITGFGSGVATALANNLNATGGPISPAPTRAGDIIYWNGSTWVTLAGNNSGTQILSENSSGVPSWSAAASGNVVGSGSSTVGDLPIINNTSTTALVDSGYNASQIPGVIPSTSTVTITNASPAVITWTAHGLAPNTPVVFSTTGALPTGLTADTGLTNAVAYYVVGSSITANTFQVATSIANAKAGTSVNTSSAGSGTQTGTANSVACTGCIGELIWAQVPFASRFALTTGTVTSIQTISVLPGIYSCAGEFGFETTGGGVATEYHLEISTTAPPTIVTAPNLGGTGGYHLTFAANQGQGFFTGPREVVAIANPTTVYQKTLSTFSNSQTTYGFVGCRRVH